MQYNENDINEKSFYILRKTDQGRFVSEFFEINDDLRTEIDVDGIISVVEDSRIDVNTKICRVNEFLDRLSSDYSFLFSDRSYCSKGALISFLCEFKPIYERSDIEIRRDEYSRIGLDLYQRELDLYHNSIWHQYYFSTWINDYYTFLFN